MIQFNELTISPDGNNLIIDVSVLPMSFYTDVYIDTITIDNQDTYISSGISNNPIYTYSTEPTESLENPETYAPIFRSNADNLKNVRLVLTTKDFLSTITNLNSNLFFVYVRVKGLPTPDVPCGMDNQTTLGIVFNKYPLYDISMMYFKELANSCEVPKNMLNTIIRLKALELALRTGNIAQAIKYWNKFFRESILFVPTTCNCSYGTTT